jgi:hypothetical protein
MAREKGLDPATGYRLPPPPEPKAEAPKPPPPARHASTGDPCPRSGLWRCVDTGQECLLDQGHPMPETAYQRPARGWLNRLRGINLAFSHMGSGYWEWLGNKPKEKAATNDPPGNAA